MHLLDNEHNAFLVDTPGIKGLGLYGFKKNEIGHFFPEIKQLAKLCKYHNCLHLNEPNCAVKNAIQTQNYKAIHPLRYDSYLTLIEDDKDR